MRSLNPRVRLERKLHKITKGVSFENKDTQKQYEKACASYKRVAKKLAVYQWAYLAVATLLYISVITTVVGSFSEFFEVLLKPVVQASQIIGIGVLSVAFFVLGSIKETVLFDLVADYARIVSYATQQHYSSLDS